MFSKKKLRNELNFIRQKLTCDVINANVRAYELLLNKEDDLGTSFRKIQSKLYKDVKLSLKAVDVQAARSNKLLIKLEELHKYQEERRCQASQWINSYLSEKEKEEERLFKQKYCNGIDVYSLTSLFNYDDTEEEVEDIEEIIETEEFEEETAQENAPADEKEAGEPAEEEIKEENSAEVLSTLLAEKEKNKETKKTESKKGRSKNETEQKIPTKTDREA